MYLLLERAGVKNIIIKVIELNRPRTDPKGFVPGRFDSASSACAAQLSGFVPGVPFTLQKEVFIMV